MQVIPFEPRRLPQAARLFTDSFRALRAQLPILPNLFEEEARVSEMLADLFRSNPGLAVVEGERLLGYMGWYLIDGFRGTRRKAALSVDWAHAAVPEAAPGVYRALYTAAAGLWFEAGCETHAVSILAPQTAHLRAVEQFWFWSGFGMTVVDAVRPIDPIGAEPPEGVIIRAAGVEDAARLAEIEAEHALHYAAPPTLMAAFEPNDTAAFRAFLSRPGHSAWLAIEGGETAGYMVFQPSGWGTSALVSDDRTIANTGAYTRPRWRGRGLAPALLDAALRHYQGQGYRRCSVDFESLNPAAVSFWTKYFQVVSESLLRVPERILAA